METGTHEGRAEALPWAHLRLPPFPQVALRVLQLLHQENVSLPQLCDLISIDAAFASEVLTVANSALYAPRYPSTSILQAVTVLGARTLQGLCITIGVRAYLGKMMAEPAMRQLWCHNLACALIAERLSIASATDKNLAFTAGILHDLGRIGLAVVRPKAYATLLETYRGPIDGLLDAERSLFGMDHCETGRQLVEEWRLPQTLAISVGDHHRAQVAATCKIGELIRVSCRLADCLGFRACPGCNAPAFENVVAEMPWSGHPVIATDASTLAAEIAHKIELLENL